MSRDELLERQYVREREITPATADVISFQIKFDRRVDAYAVFPDGGQAFEFDLIFPHYFRDRPVVSWGDSDNAFFLGRLH